MLEINRPELPVSAVAFHLIENHEGRLRNNLGILYYRDKRKHDEEHKGQLLFFLTTIIT